MVVAHQSLTNLNAQELREMVTGLMARMADQSQQITQRDRAIASKDRELKYRQTKIEQLTHEMAVLKRWKFGRSREQLDSAQASLLDETIDADIASIEEELEPLAPSAKTTPETRKLPTRAALPPDLPRVDTTKPALRNSPKMISRNLRGICASSAIRLIGSGGPPVVSLARTSMARRA